MQQPAAPFITGSSCQALELRTYRRIKLDLKAQALLDELQKIFENEVKYLFANSLLQFRIEHDGPAHWLYVAEEFVDDHTVVELLASLAYWKIPETFRSSLKSRWIFLGEEGIREVDGTFGRGR